MGCGAAKSANARGDGNPDDVEVVSSSVTQIRDMAPAEVADTGGARYQLTRWSNSMPVALGRSIKRRLILVEDNTGIVVQ
ncbi:hypothetical protein TNCV_4530571 [Trichonephila clavipes]|nr:hypothetical protein TNCV_4530571 [Trichonephila clavipes]